VQPDTPVERVLELSRTTNLDRFPIVNASGQAVGLVNVIDIVLDKSPPKTLAKYMRRIVSATHNEPAYRVLRRLRAARLGLAAVLDAKRNLIGIAADEELVKRLVQSA
jgi:CBS domain-containing protein